MHRVLVFYVVMTFCKTYIEKLKNRMGI